jgi:hypothetical protein
MTPQNGHVVPNLSNVSGRSVANSHEAFRNAALPQLGFQFAHRRKIAALARERNAALQIGSDERNIHRGSTPQTRQISSGSSGRRWQEMAESLSGEFLPEFDSRFTTGLDSNEQYALVQRPASGAGDVPVDSPILLYRLRSRGVSPDGKAFSVAQNGQPKSGLTRSNAGDIEFTPSVPFESGSAIILSLRGRAAASVEQQPTYTAALVTVGSSNSEPTPIRAFPGAKSAVSTDPVIEIEYDRALDPLSVNSDNVTIKEATDNAPIPVSVVLKGDRLIRLTPAHPLTVNATYYYEITAALKDVTGASPQQVFRRYFHGGSSAGR